LRVKKSGVKIVHPAHFRNITAFIHLYKKAIAVQKVLEDLPVPPQAINQRV
jgi:hypothetical protein